MRSPDRNEMVTAKDHFVLYRTIFAQELHAIISSREYKSRYANFSREDKRRIRENHEAMAELAARYFIHNDGANLADEKKANILIRKSILAALKTF